MKKILVPTDFSKTASIATDVAFDIAKKSVTPTQKVTPTEEPTPTESEDVLGTDTEETPTPTLRETPSPIASPSAGMNTKAIIPLLFVGSGAGLLSAVLFGKNILKKFKKS
jgi:nucleotide-binding universal stress UspA family protein